MPVNLLLCSLTLVSAESTAITNLWLNDQVVTEIPIGLHCVTTVNFPATIQSVDGVGLATDGHNPGLFQMAHPPAQSSPALRALVPSASVNINVRLEQRTFVLLLKESQNPVLAVNFLAPRVGQPHAGWQRWQQCSRAHAITVDWSARSGSCL